MSKFILGKKIGMSQFFYDDGKVVPVTLIEAGSCYIVQIKDLDKDGYCAVQLGFEKTKKINKPLKGCFKKANIEGGLKYLREFRIKKEELSKYKLGDKIDVSIFNEGEKVKVTGISKAKGFQGVVKRYKFKGSPKSHGTKHTLRAPGSIGATGPERVAKGRKMPGRMGGKQVTVSNLEIVKVIPEDNLLLIKGAVPGKRGILLKIKT